MVPLILALSDANAGKDTHEARTLRVATFNIEDVSPRTIVRDRERLRRLGQVIRDLDSDIILLNEIAYGPVRTGDAGGVTLLAETLVRGFIERSGAVPAPAYQVFAAPSNTGVHTGLDLDNNGSITPEPGSRAYAGDCHGYGTFEGQYAMALLVRADLRILRDEVRTFREFLWADVPGALLPPLIEAEGGAVVERAWYSEEERAILRLSSKSHWDVPVELPGGRVLHVLCSHPTPPVFDGPEDRNGRRNHDEIRFWAEYVGARAGGHDWIVDDAGTRAHLAPDADFVILGDLNADPDEGDSFANPIKMLLEHPRVNAADTPISTVEIDGLDPDDTARFKLRVDYVLPSAGLDVLGAGVVRGPEDLPPPRDGAGADGVSWSRWDAFPSDHFPVWVDIALGDEDQGQ